MKIIYKRVVLKISGEIIKDIYNSQHKQSIIYNIAKDIKSLIKLGLQVSIMIGGGNLFRGKSLFQFGINRVNADYIGILSTMINGIFLKDVFNQFNIPVCLMSAIPVNSMFVHYNVEKSIHLLSKSIVVIFCGGLGSPYFTTDSAACLRAIETNSDIVMKGTKVNGVYSKDPLKYHDAILYNELNYKDILNYECKVMDLTAFILARDYKLPICIFNINNNNALYNIVTGKKEGTIISDVY